MTRREFGERFLEVFAADIPPRILKKYRIALDKYFLWNLFGAKLIPCYEGDSARREYDKANKINAQMIEYDADWLDPFLDRETVSSRPLPAEMLTSKGVDAHLYPESYIFGENFSWCYVITHEGDLCGPYFCYNPNLS